MANYIAASSGFRHRDLNVDAKKCSLENQAPVTCTRRLVIVQTILIYRACLSPRNDTEWKGFVLFMGMSSQAERGVGEQKTCVRKQPLLSFCWRDILPKLTGLLARGHKAAFPVYNAFSKLGYHLLLLVKLTTQLLASSILKSSQVAS